MTNNEAPICIDCNDQDEQVWDEYLWEWRCKRFAEPDEEIPTDYEEVDQ